MAASATNTSREFGAVTGIAILGAVVRPRAPPGTAASDSAATLLAVRAVAQQALPLRHADRL